MNATSLKVILSAGNIGHYHHTALALQNAGYLAKYFCVFSGIDDLKYSRKFLSTNDRLRLAGKSLEGLEEGKIRTIPFPYLLTQALGRAGIIPSDTRNALFSAAFDLAVRQELNDANVFHFVSSLGLKSGALAKKRNMLTICDVRSAHIDSEYQILADEHDRLHLPFSHPSVGFRNRILDEYDLADFLIVPSKYVAETMIDHGVPEEEIVVIPYGVDLSRFSFVAPNVYEPTKPGEGIKILFVGSITPGKGVHFLIEALENVDLPNCELTIIGKEVEPQYRRLLVSMIKRSNVHFIEHMPQSELHHYYEQANLFVLPSLSEGSALVVYEAMSAGLPILATFNSGSVVKDGFDGFIIPPMDINALVEKLVWFYEHPLERLEMGLNALNHVQDFTWEKYGERIIDFYRNLENEAGTQTDVAALNG